MSHPYEMLEQPSMIWTRKTDKNSDLKVHEWIEPIGEELPDGTAYDATIVGVPLSKSSISTSAASENPDAMRRTWQSFRTYNLDEDIDLANLNVIDLGNVKQHVTDIAFSQQQMKEAMTKIREDFAPAVSIALGGDHSITAMLVQGWKEAHPNETVGILQLDTHFDLRDLTVFGPANGTPIRNLIESGTVKGSHVHNLGLHGFFNAKELKDYADEVGVHYKTMKQVRKQGIEAAIQKALAQLEQEVDTVYLTVDMDVLDIVHGPGTPAASPGGMYAHELLEAVQIAGEHPKVKAMDIVCVDPRKDIGQITVKHATHTMLSFLVGYYKRIRE